MKTFSIKIDPLTGEEYFEVYTRGQQLLNDPFLNKASAFTEEERLNRLSELNVIAQLRNLCKISTVQRAFKNGKYPQLHGWIFAMKSGLIQEQKLPIREWKEMGLLPKDFPE